MGGRSQLQSIKLAVHTTTQVHEDWDEKDSAPIAIRSHNNAENGLGLQVRQTRCVSFRDLIHFLRQLSHRMDTQDDLSEKGQIESL